MRTVTIDLEEILDVVSAAEDYGYGDDVLFDALANWAGAVSDAEIAEHATAFLSEDYVRRRLTEWRDRYCKPGTAKEG